MLDLTKNLISILQVTNVGYSFTFTPHNCIVQDKSNQVITICEQENNLYKLGILVPCSIDAYPCIDTIIQYNPNIRNHDLWHRKLCHINVQKMKLM